MAEAHETLAPWAEIVLDAEPMTVNDLLTIPDVGFYVAARQSLIVDPNKPIPFAPDLAVEVATPSQRTGDLAAKVALYLAGGTRLVWVVWPDRQQVDVWHPGDIGPSATLGVSDTLDGEDVIPGFIHPVADIFAQ